MLIEVKYLHFSKQPYSKLVTDDGMVTEVKFEQS